MRKWGLISMLAIACSGPDGVRQGDEVESWGSAGADTDDADGTADSADGDGSDGSDGGGDSSGDDGGDGGSEPLPPRVPTYHEAQQKSSHNSYERHEALVDQLAYHRVRSLELDIHRDGGVFGSEPGNWFVYHDVPGSTTCLRLSDCLQDVRAFTNGVVDHEVITLWLDLKDGFTEGYGPAELDVLLDEYLGSDLFTPGELMDRCPDAGSLRDAAFECGWPTLPELRGRVIVMLTGGTITQPEDRLARYAAEGQRGFVAPNMPDKIEGPELDAVVVLNAEVDQTNALRAAVHDGFIGRVWGVNSESAWLAVADAKVQHIATDKVNWEQDPWAVTHDPDTGWPFTCTGDCGSTESEPEPGTVLGIVVDSGDIWDDADDFAFAHLDAGTQDEAWTVLVSGANSHVEKWVKGCLMARVDLEPGSPYFAVCRPADEEPVRVQKRTDRNGGSDATENDIVSGGLSPTSVAWLRLDLSDGGRCVTGYGAHQRDQWVEIDSQCFDEPLTVRGLAASSHGAGVAHMLFVAPRRDATMLQMDMLSLDEVGAAAGELFDGPIPHS
jgi:hypothetical protein